jgi:transposase
MSTEKISLRYSLAFKQKVVSEIESGEFNVHQARKFYGITGCGTIEGWIKKLGKNHLLGKVVRVEMTNEKDRIKQLEEEKRQLESALAHAHLKNMALESLIEVAEKYYEVDLKKNFGEKASKRSSKK